MMDLFCVNNQLTAFDSELSENLLFLCLKKKKKEDRAKLPSLLSFKGDCILNLRLLWGKGNFSFFFGC